MKEHNKAADILLKVCGGCQKSEKVLIVTDPSSVEIANVLFDAAVDFPKKTLVMMEETGMHAADPPELVRAAMMEADVIFGCTRFSLFHSKAKKEACKKGARFVNMVDYSMEMLQKGGLYSDFYALGELCMNIAGIFEGKETCHITTELGTDFKCSIKGRKPTPQIGRSLTAGISSSPPDVECATCAVEGTAEGIVIVDGSIPFPGLGIITEPIKLTVKEGEIVGIEGGQQAEIFAGILKESGDRNAYIIGEIGLGLNPGCSLTGRMLEDEGCSGTVHLACGDNIGFVGNTASRLHMDMVFKNPTLTADDTVILDRGVVVI